jgi:hypothetical protein
MNTFTLLAVVSVLGAWALFIALALFLRQICMTLEDIGGPSTRFYHPKNFLAKIRLGVRAIETQTAALGPAVTQLNGGLSAVRDGLKAIDQNLAGVIDAASRQGGAR